MLRPLHGISILAAEGLEELRHVGQVLAQGGHAVDAQARQGLEGIELLHHQLGAGVEGLGVLRGSSFGFG